jgi:probable HAF family extracellular repeat protein
MIDLNNLVDPSTGWVLESADGINDSGQIVGYGVNPSGQTHAFLLTPTPEPSTLCLAITCGSMLLASHLCRRRLLGEMLDRSSATYYNEGHWVRISP